MQPAALSSAAPRARLGGSAGWTILWAALAVLHATQGIWLSVGRAYPGDLADGRFNQLVLEHGYQSLRGVYDWVSPSLFYPTPHTLGLSDTHAGTLPIYAALRAAGFTVGRAWQGWFVVVVGLNVFAATRLFTALGIARWLRGPLVFAAVASVTTVWVAGTHMQLLPCFPGLLGCAALVEWSRDRAPNELLAASGWFAWQFAASPYLTFFGAIIVASIGLLRWLAGGSVEKAGGVPRQGPRGSDWLGAGAVALAGWGLASFAAVAYFHSVQSGAGRSMEEVRAFTPHFRSWFTAAPAHVFYRAGWPGGMSNLAEHAWFAGFLPWLLLIPAALVGWRARHRAIGVWMLVLAGGALATALFFTQWGEPGCGAWIFVAEKVDSLRAFRSSARVAVVLHIVEIAAAGALLTHWLGEGMRCRRWTVGGLTALILLEGLGSHQPVTLIATAERRTDAMVAAWREAGDRPVLAFAFGYTNQPEPWLHLDAWSAALRLGRATLNGYSGGQPGTYHRFLWNPTAANARDLLQEVGVAEQRVSLVERFSAADETALGIERQSQRPVDPLVDFDLQPRSWTLFAPLEHSVIEGVTMYQFTPAAEVRFRVPDEAREVGYLVGFRPDAYSLGGRTDGAGVTWSIESPGHPEKVLSRELLTPLTRPEHRGLLPRSFELPEGHDRMLVLRTDTGTANDLPWDFLLVGRLRVK